jgi:hypothetical protein
MGFQKEEHRKVCRLLHFFETPKRVSLSCQHGWAFIILLISYQ